MEGKGDAMSARLAAFAATICLLGGLSAPASAEPLMFSVTADNAASARFYLATDTTLTFSQALVTTSADYAGIVLYSDDGRLQGGILTAPALSTAGHDVDEVYLGPPDGTVFRQGWYRVVVLANAPTAVRIPVVRGSALNISATTRNAQTHQILSETLPAQGRVTAELRAPLPPATPTGRVAVLARLSPAVVDGKVTLVTCLSHRGKPCGKRDTRSELHSNQPGVNATRMIQAGLSTPVRSPGARDALARVTLTPLASVPFGYLVLHWNDPRR